MTENLPIKVNPRPKPYPYPLDTLLCFLLAIVLVAILAKPLADARIMEWWWGFFMVCNLGYILYGMKKGWAKGDPGAGLSIAMGPMSFYFWTFVGAWRTYHVYKKDGYGWTIKKLEKELAERDLTKGFDFDFLFKHRRPVYSLLKRYSVCVEEVLDEPWEDEGKSWWCLSIADTPLNMAVREELR